VPHLTSGGVHGAARCPRSGSDCPPPPPAKRAARTRSSSLQRPPPLVPPPPLAFQSLHHASVFSTLAGTSPRDSPHALNSKTRPDPDNEKQHTEPSLTMGRRRTKDDAEPLPRPRRVDKGTSTPSLNCSPSRKRKEGDACEITKLLGTQRRSEEVMLRIAGSVIWFFSQRQVRGCARRRAEPFFPYYSLLMSLKLYALAHVHPAD